MSGNDETSFEPLLSDEEAQKVIRGPLHPGDYYLFGSDACVEGAIFAGCRYYAGYPITPASEIMERSAQRMPQVGGRFIQMEDEIASACSLIGASFIADTIGEGNKFGEMGSGDLSHIVATWGCKAFGLGVIRPECNIHGKEEFVYLQGIEDVAQILASFLSPRD